MPKPPTKVVVETEREERRAVQIEPTAIQEEYAALPSNLNRWCHLLAIAGEELQRAELDLEEWDAKERIRIREFHETKGLKPPTVDALDSAILSNPMYRQLKEEIINATRNKQDVFATVESIRAKKEMLISLGADMRQERDGDRELVLRERR
jgi:hypothetical protein